MNRSQIAGLRKAVLAAREVSRRAQVRPWDHFRPLPGQLAVLKDASSKRLFRGPNQALGKTTAGALDMLGHATGLHPWASPEILSPTPIEAWVNCATWSQSIAIQGKIYELTPKDLLHPRTEFDPALGFRGKHPNFRIRHTSGGYSTIRIRTTKQGGLALSGASIDYAWFDEPPTSSRVYSEVVKRVTMAGRYGRTLLTLTPVNAPVGWIKREAEEGRIVDHHRRLAPEELIPVGSSVPLVLPDGTVCDEAWIQTVIEETLPHERPVVCFGEWSFATENPVFTAFRPSGPDSHVLDFRLPASVDFALGLDHGDRDHSEVAILMAIQHGRPAPRVWVIDLYQSSGSSHEDDDAEEILRMLERNGLTWNRLKIVYGDRAHHGSNRRGSVAKKSNGRLSAALERHVRAKRHGIRRGYMSPQIRGAKRGVANQPGSVSFGCTWLHRLMLRRGHFYVHPRCRPLIESLQRYRMRPNSEWSHTIDALRYGLRDLIFDRMQSIPKSAVCVY